MKKVRNIKPIKIGAKNSQNIFQKAIRFIKYHNAFSIIFMVVFMGFSLSFAASQDMREAVFQRIEEQAGIDNGILLVSDIENWQFESKILSIEEDGEYYYVSYQFRTLGVFDNIWQEIWQENLLKFEKNSDRYINIEDYIVEEIGEVIAHQHQLLKDSQRIAREQGRTQRVKVVVYNGLVGRVLNLETKVVPLENPLMSEPTLEFAIQPQPPQVDINQPFFHPDYAPQELTKKELIDKELIRKMVEEILAQKNLDQPVAPDQELMTIPTPTPTPVDPVPVDQPPTLEPEPALACSPDHLDLCITQELCETAGLYWYNEICNIGPKAPEALIKPPVPVSEPEPESESEPEL